MRVAYKRIVFILYAISLIAGFAAPNPASGRELVGIVPFTNQREDHADDWLGFYIQARLQANLAEGCDCDFHTLNTIRLWQFKANPSVPISVRNTLIVTGSFQFVLEQGIIEIRIKRYSPESFIKEFEITFGKAEFETKLDHLSDILAQWITPDFNREKRFHYPQHTEKSVKEAFQFRQQLYQPETVPEFHSMLTLKDLIAPESPAGFVADLAEGMIIVSRQLPEMESKPLLEEAERLLRSSAMVHTQDARILSLLAEIFFLNGREPSWVEKTAEQAVQLNEFDELSWLILVLTAGDSTEKTRQELKRMNDINPWIWPVDMTEKESAQFQMGLFKSELLSLHKSLR